MSVLAITCDNCGAKYRLPETFQGDKAKCQKCGSVIDVAAQRKAAAAPAPTAKPAAAPAAKKEPVARAPRESAKAAESAPRARRGRDKDADAAPAAETKGGRSRGERSKGGEERAPKKNNTMLLAGGGIAALAIVAVIIVLSTNRKDTPTGTNQAQGNVAEKPANAAKDDPKAPPVDDQKPADSASNAVADANGSAAKGEAVPALSPGQEQSPKPATGEQPKPAEPKKDAPAETPAPKSEATPADATKEKWELNKTTSLDQVFDAKTLGDVKWPEEIAAEQQTEVRSLVEDVVNGGRAGIAAKPKLEKLGFSAIFGLIERLRQLDYKSGDEQMTAWELNKILESILVTLNAGFVAVEAGSDLDPRKADHNARTNQAWDRLLTKWASKEEFDTWRKEKLAEKSKK